MKQCALTNRFFTEHTVDISSSIKYICEYLDVSINCSIYLLLDICKSCVK